MDPAVFGYIRVSQVEGESGLATQRRILNDHGLRDDRIFTDVASGRNMHRPSWRELRGMLKPGDTVVVPRIDRLARNLTEGLKTIEELHDQGINIRSLAEGLDTGDDSPTSRLMLHMLLSLAEWERDTIRDRIRAGVDRAAAEGRTGGRRPALSSEKMKAVKSFLENGGMVLVYPRECGGTASSYRAPSNVTGLSPRVRGNLEYCQSQKPIIRSIPASAGEPPVGGSSGSWGAVYPRECGGTHTLVLTPGSVAGLSPRVRGNPLLAAARTLA